MVSEQLRSKTAERLRDALASGAFDEAQAVLDEYRGHVEDSLAAGPTDAVSPAELAREVDELMAWALRVVRVARARTREQLEQVSAVIHYLSAAPPGQTLKMDG